MDRWIADTDPGVKFPAWTRGNAADVFPDPASPFFATTYLRTSLGKGLVDAYSTIGVFDWDEVENPVDPTMFGVFGGYIYNPLSYTRLFGARMPGASPNRGTSRRGTPRNSARRRAGCSPPSRTRRSKRTR